jgi:hypothetical protein
MHQVVRHLAVLHCGTQVIDALRIALNDLDLISPRHIAEFLRRASKHSNCVTGGEELGHESTPDVAGGSCDQAAHCH